MKTVRTISVLLLLVCITTPSFAHESNHGGSVEGYLGAVDFANSCHSKVQEQINRGVALLHHMMYVESRSAFEAIAENAPGCAMAQWGLAMTLFQPLWPSRPTSDDLRRGAAAVKRAIELDPATDRERALRGQRITQAGAR